MSGWSAPSAGGHLPGLFRKEVGIRLVEEADPCPVSQLDHALYLGRELQRAEACLESGRDYVQD